MTWSSVALWAGLLSSLRAGTTDFSLRPERWTTRGETPAIEAVLREPLSGPAAIDALGARLKTADGAAGMISAGFDELGVTPAAPALPGPVAATPGVPADVAPAVATLVARLIAARADLRRAVDSLTPEERARALRAADSALDEDPVDDPRAENFDAALRYDLPRLAAAGLAAARAADESAAAFARAAPGPAFSTSWESEIGTVLVSSGDAELGAEELARAGLIVRLGGRTRYAGPAAAAGEGEVRVVIDVGGPATLASDGSAGGSGRFGIGLLYLLGSGPHAVSAGTDSLGAARFGVGAAVVAGNRTLLSARELSEGAAMFGVGVLDTRGDGAELKETRAGQGFGATRGAGLWRHRGADLDASCGFSVVDAHEPLGSVSEGQGAGLGPRAFAAGGVGAAYVSGIRARLNASYFAQGAGYWHGLGALYVRGDDARLQARRYALGAGVHAAVGALDVQGRGARVAGWGGAFALGWDYGVGLARVVGDAARVRVDWSAARGDLGGRALAWVEGDRDELALDGVASGNFLRAEAGYGLAVIRGAGARLRAPALASPARIAGPAVLRVDPWGAALIDGEAELDPGLSLPDAVWTPATKDARAKRESGAAARPAAPPAQDERLARARALLRAASADILDPRPAESAALGLTELADDDAPALARALDRDRYDELLWARLAAAGLGPAAARAAAEEAGSAQGERRAALLDWLRFGRAEEALPPLEAALRDPDWRARRQAALVLGALFGVEGGEEPGRRRLLREAAAATATPESLGRRRLPDLYAALALGGATPAELRARLLAAAGSPFDAVSADAVRVFIAALAAAPARAAALAREEYEAARLAPRAAEDLRRAAEDPDDEVASAALQSLGFLGFDADAARLAAGLSADGAARRDAAASGLAQLGRAAAPALARALSATDARTRALAALAAAQSWDASVFNLLGRALEDADAGVRAAAVAGIGAEQNTMGSGLRRLRPALERLAGEDADPGVRAAAALAAARLPP